jgi:hypothetical protein
MFLIQYIVLLNILIVSYVHSQTIPPPDSLQIHFSEKSFEIDWNPVPGAKGYNVYHSYSAHSNQNSPLHKLNKVLIRSGTHFTYIWKLKNGQHIPDVKGHRHYIGVSSVSISKKDTLESPLSPIWTNDYFQNYSSIKNTDKINRVLLSTQKTPFLPIKESITSKEKIAAFIEGPGQLLYQQIRQNIDPLEVGGCAPISVVAVKLMNDFGITAYRAEGNFISEYHAFTVINIDKIEYILDFAADQFIPDVSPVLIPRDYCFLNKNGSPDTSGAPIYTIDRVYGADQVELTNAIGSDIYKKIYQSVKKTLDSNQ